MGIPVVTVAVLLGIRSINVLDLDHKASSNVSRTVGFQSAYAYYIRQVSLTVSSPFKACVGSLRRVSTLNRECEITRMLWRHCD